MHPRSHVPDNLPECQQALLAALEHLAQIEQQASEQERVLDQTAASYDTLQQDHATILEELAALKRWVFGRRRERFKNDKHQGHLFDLEADASAEANKPEESDDGKPDIEVKGHRRHSTKRGIDWDKLPKTEHRHELPQEEKVCSCCGRQKDHIGDDVTRELEFQPPKLEAHVHIRPKYACRHCKDGVASAPLPSRPIPGGIAGPGLIAQVIVSKFGDHLPLYRLEDIFPRHGVHLSRSTLCDWVKVSAELLEPLHDLQRELVLQSPVMWTDDTAVTVLGGPAGSFRGHFWTYIGDEQYPYSVYHFTTSRKRDGPATFLEGFTGYLHADAFTGYDAIFLNPNTAIYEVACWAHARRKFFDAAKNYPRQSYQILEWIRQLYDIEDRAREMSVDTRCELRIAEARPILDKIGSYVSGLAASVLPKSSLGKAVTYVTNQWPALQRYTEDGRLTIDNNVSERTLRHQAIGRKNWMFLGSEAAGPRAAVLCTVLAGAKRHRIEPWAYVRDLLLRLHADDSNLHELLPDRWAASHPEAVLTHRIDEARAKAARSRERRARRRTCRT